MAQTKYIRKRVASALAALLTLVVGAPPAAAPAAAEGGSIAGRISVPAVKAKKRFSRAALYRSRLAVAKKQEAAPRPAPTASVIVSAHPLSFEPVSPPGETARIEQLNTEFVPHVTVVTPGTPLHFVNQDGIYHNVFSLTPGARFNIGRKPTGEVAERVIERPGKVELFCDIHPQMNAVVLVLDTPYFVRPAADGTYLLEGLPAGEYELHLFHPAHDAIKERVVVEEGQALQRDFRLGE